MDYSHYAACLVARFQISGVQICVRKWDIVNSPGFRDTFFLFLESLLLIVCFVCQICFFFFLLHSCCVDRSQKVRKFLSIWCFMGHDKHPPDCLWILYSLFSSVCVCVSVAMFHISDLLLCIIQLISIILHIWLPDLRLLVTLTCVVSCEEVSPRSFEIY